MNISLVIKSSSHEQLITSTLLNAFPHFKFFKLDDKYFNAINLDLLIVDLDVNMDILKIIKEYKDKETTTIVWGSTDHRDLFSELIKLNINGFFCNSMDRNEIIKAIHFIIDGNYYFHPHLTAVMFEEYKRLFDINNNRPANLLTKREWEILELITQGYNNSQISNQLFISEKTVKNHVSSILGKLSVPDRTNAMIMAIKNRWFVI